MGIIPTKPKADLDIVTIISRGEKIKGKGKVEDEFNNLAEKLKSKGEIKTVQLKKENETKIGAIIWKHTKLGSLIPDYLIIITFDRKRFLKKATSLMNIEKIVDDYPGVSIHKLSSLVFTRSFYKELEKSKAEYKERKTKGSRGTRELNIAIIRYTSNNELYELFNKLKGDTPNKEGEVVLDGFTIDSWLNKINQTAVPQVNEYTAGGVGLVKDKEILMSGFNKNANNPLIQVLIWHEKVEGGADEYWLLILVNKELGTEINEDSLKDIATRTGIPLIEWGRFKQLGLITKGVIKNQIRDTNKEFKKGFYYIKSLVIRELYNNKKVKEETVKKKIEEELNKVNVPDVFKEDKIIGNRTKELMEEFNKSNTKELKEEYENSKKSLKELGLNITELSVKL